MKRSQHHLLDSTVWAESDMKILGEAYGMTKGLGKQGASVWVCPSEPWS